MVLEAWCCSFGTQSTDPFLPLLSLTSKGIPKAYSLIYLKDLVRFYH